VPVPPVVEARLALEPEAHPATDADDSPDQLLLAAEGHEVLHLADAIARQEAGDQHVGVRQAQLFRGTLTHRRDPVMAALFAVEDRAEHAGGVERERAVPVDRAVGGHQRDRAQVADHAVARDREIDAGTDLEGLMHGRCRGRPRYGGIRRIASGGSLVLSLVCPGKSFALGSR
jgi:hypothetical protein